MGRSRRAELVLAHGGWDHAWGFAVLAPLLAERFCVIALDARGHGDSEWAGAYTWSADIRDLLNVVLALDRPVVLVGHSKGGGQVTAAAWLLDDRVRKVVNIDGFGPPPFPPEAMQSLAQRCADYLDVRRRSFERSDWRPYQSLEQLSRYGRTVPHLLVGALVNAHAVGERRRGCGCDGDGRDDPWVRRAQAGAERG